MGGLRLRATSVALALALSVPALAGDGGEPPSLMGWVERSRIAGPVERARVRVSGWVQASVGTTVVADEDPRDARVFDDLAQGFRWNQSAVLLDRRLSDGGGFDVGGRAVVLWGSDARLLHSRGLLDDQGEDVEQVDLVELHATVRPPLSVGLTFRVGKLATPLGYETIPAPENALPSRSFLFGYAIPFTHTGVLATLDLGGGSSLSYGVVRGWDVWDDSNDAATHLGSATWTSPSGRDTVVLSAIAGAETPGDEQDVRVVVDGVWKHRWSDVLSTAANATWGFEENASAGDDGRWWGIAGYAARRLGPCLAATVRAEWFEDEGGSRLGRPVSLWGLTLGLDWTPLTRLRNVHLRPEVRWDHAHGDSFFDGGSEADQVSLALDVVATF